MERAISTLTVMPATKAEVRSYAAKVVEEALSGNYDLVEIARQLKAVTDAAKMISDELKPHFVQEMEKHGKGKHSYMGCEFELRRRKSYDYAGTGDPVYVELKEKLKEREAFLKALKSTIYDEAAGGAEINPPNYTESEYYILNLK